MSAAQSVDLRLIPLLNHAKRLKKIFTAFLVDVLHAWCSVEKKQAGSLVVLPGKALNPNPLSMCRDKWLGRAVYPGVVAPHQWHIQNFWWEKNYFAYYRKLI